MKLYAYKTKDGRYLAEMEPCGFSKRPIIGAVDPATDGNYYKELCIDAIKNPSKFVLGAVGWLKWLREDGLPRGYVVMSDDFDFDPKEVKVVTFSEVK